MSNFSVPTLSSHPSAPSAAGDGSAARPAVPPRALALSTAALAVPLYSTLFAPASSAEYEILLWLLALIPAFLLAYYRGWPGAALALAIGMGVLTIAQLLVTLSGRPIADWRYLLVFVAAYTGISLGIGWTSELLHRERDRAAALALTDELTGLANRRRARLVLEQEFAAAQRGRQLAVVLFDLDHFKGFNDRHGHAAGDEALRLFARVLRHTTRQMNLAARLGGEEFVAILSDTRVEGACAYVERVRSELARSVAPEAPFTVSAGVSACCDAFTTVDELLAAADAALYLAKARGRDRVEVFEPAPPLGALPPA